MFSLECRQIYCGPATATTHIRKAILMDKAIERTDHVALKLISAAQNACSSRRHQCIRFKCHSILTVSNGYPLQSTLGYSGPRFSGCEGNDGRMRISGAGVPGAGKFMRAPKSRTWSACVQMNDDDAGDTMVARSVINSRGDIIQLSTLVM